MRKRWLDGNKLLSPPFSSIPGAEAEGIGAETATGTPTATGF